MYLYAFLVYRRNKLENVAGWSRLLASRLGLAVALSQQRVDHHAVVHLDIHLPRSKGQGLREGLARGRVARRGVALHGGAGTECGREAERGERTSLSTRARIAASAAGRTVTASTSMICSSSSGTTAHAASTGQHRAARLCIRSGSTARPGPRGATVGTAGVGVGAPCSASYRYLAYIGMQVGRGVHRHAGGC